MIKTNINNDNKSVKNMWHDFFFSQKENKLK